MKREQEEKQIEKRDRQALARCVVCRVCGIKPVWGAAFLLCLRCGQESDYNWPNGTAVRHWNRVNGSR
jgi:hypothetical protein